jgi:hypothetical protein
MCCIISSILFIGPRAGLLVWWLFNPGRFSMVYNNLMWPILGTIFLPVTTLIYTFIYKAGFGGPAGLDWIWLGLGLVIDLGLYGGGAYSRKK